jgi:cold shock protein
MSSKPDSKDLLIGTVIWFDAEKGYGFVEAEEGGRVFFHHTSLRMEGYRTIPNGAPVEYDVMRHAETGRWQAASVRAL